MTNRPENDVFKVTVEASGGFYWSWEGYADNLSEALYKTLEKWESQIAGTVVGPVTYWSGEGEVAPLPRPNPAD